MWHVVIFLLSLLWLPEISGSQWRIGIFRELSSSNSLVIVTNSPTQYPVLEQSETLTSWKEIFRPLLSQDQFGTYSGQIVLHDGFLPSTGFYRAKVSQPPTVWRNQASVASDEFFQSDEGGLIWLKFTIPKGSGKVYFQNTKYFPFHVDFVRATFQEHSQISSTEFDLISLFPGPQQEYIVGTVIKPLDSNINEVGIQLMTKVSYSTSDTISLLNLVWSNLPGIEGASLFFFPAPEQAAQADLNALEFAREGFNLSSVARWQNSSQVYSAGWGIGKLQMTTKNGLEDAFRAGVITADSIVIVDQIPPEIPPLRGVIALAPSVPYSHVALLAQSIGVPIAFVSDPTSRARLFTLTNKIVYLDSTVENGVPKITIEPIEDLPSDIIDHARTLLPTSGNLPLPMERYNDYIYHFTQDYPAASKIVGGKAANYAFLLKFASANTRPALAISFNLWEDFRNQILPSGKSLIGTINTVLSKHSYPPNMSVLVADLKTIRDLVRDGNFNGLQRDVIKTALSDKFNPSFKIRFRSSSNLEDLEDDSTAGLFDSYSGCLADDMDEDTLGPSGCDGTEPEEKGVFRAIKRVFASLYNDYAVLERLHRGIKEEEIGMSILVHHSFPDETEKANGVAVITPSTFGTIPHFKGTIVSQLGAISVSNPDSSLLPEVVAFENPRPTVFSQIQRSSALRFGSTFVMEEYDYEILRDLFSNVSEGYQGLSGKNTFTLNFEFKKVIPDGIVLKQVRELPKLDSNTPLQTVTRGEVGIFEIYQREFTKVFANHRLKPQLAIRFKPIILTDSNLAELDTLFSTTSLSINGPSGTVAEFVGTPSSFPAFSRSTSSSGNHHTETMHWRGEATKYFISSSGIPKTNFLPKGPLVFISDPDITLEAHYDTPKLALEGPGTVSTIVPVSQESVKLVPPQAITDKDTLQIREFSINGVTIQTKFLWPPWSDTLTTAPLRKFVKTAIVGLTQDEISLTSYFSQTYAPGHHNGYEEFVFEPAVDPNVSSQIKAELDAKNIAYIYFIAGLDPIIAFYSRNGEPVQF